MRNHRTDPPQFEARDPASERLTRDQVIAIHRSHINGIPWATIADEQGTNRSNVKRIVHGVRHRRLHPNVAPELYSADPPAVDDAEVVQVVNDTLREARDTILRELRERRAS